MSIQTHTTTCTDTNSSFHAKQKFRERIDSDVTLLQSCWYDGQRIEASELYDYDVARVYEGPLCEDCVMLAEQSELTTCEYIITTVIPANRVVFEYAE